MAGIIKHTEQTDHADFANAKIAWLKTKTNLKIKSGQRVIKSTDLSHADMSKEIPNVNSQFDDFRVISIQDGDQITGVEVTCRCGGKIEIMFDYDEENPELSENSERAD